MSKFGDSLASRLGHITGNAFGYGVFGEAGADRRRYSINQEAKADAIRERESSRAKIEQDNYINSIDAAVLRNVDAVISQEFSDNPDEVVKQLMGLIVQVKTNSFKAFNKEEKVRTKYTYAVVSKMEQGVNWLEYIDPMNPRLSYITWQYLKAKWRRVFSIRIGFSDDSKAVVWGLVGLAFMFGIIGIMAYKENGGEILPWIILALGVILLLFLLKYIILGIFLWVHKLKRNRTYRLMLMSAETAPTKIENKKPNPSEVEVEPVAEVIKTPVNDIVNDEVVKTSYMESAYDLLWNEFGASHPILKRGYKVAINDEQKDILILGFNPRLIGNSTSSTFRFPDVEHPYPYLVKHMLVSDQNDLMGRSTYLDMFGFKEPNHEVAMQNIICNPKVFGYVAAQVALTQDVIEDVIRPKLIVILDQDIWAFFGKVKGLTWMGYSFKSLGDINGYELCEITGFTKAKDRISQDSRLASTLVGTKVLFTDGKHVSKFPKPEDIIKYIY